jgi:calcium-dependent protein kinase
VPAAEAAAAAPAGGPATARDLYRADDAPARAFGFLSAADFDARFELNTGGAQLGAGAFSVVLGATERSTGRPVAVKRSAKRRVQSGAMDALFARRVRNEADIGARLGATLAAAELLGAYEDEGSVSLVLERCSGGRLGGPLAEAAAAPLAAAALRAVAQAHAAGVVLRDVKPDNFLFAAPGRRGAPGLRAIDFGVSVFAPRNSNWVDAKAGSPMFVAPDVLRSRYGAPADLWSLGVTLYTLLAGRLPFGGEEGEEVAARWARDGTFDHKEAFRAVLYAPLDFERPPWGALSPAAAGFARALLTRDPAARPTALEALRHPWLRALGVGGGGGLALEDTVVARLQRFALGGPLKRAAQRRVAALGGAAPPAAALMGLFDAAAAGAPVAPEAALRAALRARFALEDDEAAKVMAPLAGADGGGVLRDAWAAAVADWGGAAAATPAFAPALDAAFREADADADGALGRADLARFLTGAAPACPDLGPAALREADADGDGRVSRAEFAALLAAPDAPLEAFDARARGG